jgi:dolichol-phosphate mannosyltransferase
MTPRILLFVPMFNCEAQIRRVINSLNSNRGWLRHYIDQVLLIDNCSTDHSFEIATEALTDVSWVQTVVMRNQNNINLGGSHKAAFSYCIKEGFEYCIVLHGDDQASISDLAGILREKDYQYYDLILGARFKQDATLVNYSKIRELGNRALNLILSIIVNKRIYDLGSGLNLFGPKVLLDDAYLHFDNDLTFNIFLLLHSIKSKKRLLFFPITWREEDQISNAKVFRQGMKTIGIFLRYLVKRIDSSTNNQPPKNRGFD